MSILAAQVTVIGVLNLSVLAVIAGTGNPFEDVSNTGCCYDILKCN